MKFKLDRRGLDKWKTDYSYDPNSGIFIDINTQQLAGILRRDGYIQLNFSGGYALAHRIAFLYMTGSYPKGEVDHINGIRSDNRWKNLRDVSKQQNQWNASLRSDNLSGVKGVSWVNREKRWVARIQVNGKRICIGYFKNLEDAETAIQKVRVSLHSEFYNHG